MLREYLISEAMNSLNIPTTRSLAVVKTGEDVIREKPLPGAILRRVASSDIRVGTFQFIRTRDNLNELDTLVNYTIKRHFPEISKSKNKPHDLLNVLIANVFASPGTPSNKIWPWPSKAIKSLSTIFF